MRIWKASSSSKAKGASVVDNSKEVVIVGGSTAPKHNQIAEGRDEILNVGNKNSNNDQQWRMPRSQQALPPPPPVEDTRHEASPVLSSPKVKERKQNLRASTGRGSFIKKDNVNEVSASSNRDLPEGEPKNNVTTPSYTLSRLLFTKQNMEQRDQMKVVYSQFGFDATDTLVVESDDGMPSPDAADHVVVKVQASTVTLEDCLLRRGFDFNILDPICLPQTPGFDIVGHICAKGSKVDPSFDEGDRVAALIRTGGNARFVSVPSSSLVKIPRNIDSAEAAAMVSTFTTAYQTLKRIKQQGSMFSLLGKRVLVLGGMDGVGQALIQMCLKARAEIYAPCPRSCHNYMQNVLGAHPLPEDTDQWLLLVESQMDYVFDGVCEDGLETSQKALTADGELVCYGHTSMIREKEIGLFGAPLTAHVNKLWSQTKSKAKTFDIWESFKEDPDTYKKNLKSLCQLLKWNKIKPNITCRVGLSEVAEAQSKLENGEVYGTIVCLPWTHVEKNKQ